MQSQTGEQRKAAARINVDPRVPLAMERTFLAWIRTGLAMMGFGFVVARFGLFLREIEIVRGGTVAAGRGISPLIGTALVALGVGVTAYAAIRFRAGLASIERGESPLARSEFVPILFAVVLCALGVVTVVYLVATS
jgi:putative membrane protein